MHPPHRLTTAFSIFSYVLKVFIILASAVATGCYATNATPAATQIRNRVPADWFTGNWSEKECPSCGPLIIDMSEGNIISITKKKERILEAVPVDRGVALLTDSGGDGTQGQDGIDLIVLVRVNENTLILRDTSGINGIFVRSEKRRQKKGPEKDRNNH